MRLRGRLREEEPEFVVKMVLLLEAIS